MDEKSEQRTTSSALREWIRRARADCHMSLRELDAIADHIDAEMVELPRDANNETIHLGDKTYDLDGNEQAAISFQLYGEEDPTWMVNCPDGHVAPYNLTHKRPDILELIADELDEMVRGDHTVENFAQDWERLHELCQRIRKQMKEREHE